MFIRLLKKDDLIELENIEESLFDNPFSKESCLEELITDNRLYLGLFDDNQLVGYVGVMITFDTADIIKVGVKKEYQGKGYSKRLMYLLLQVLKDNGVKYVMLEVEHSNYKAINLYLSCGFKEISERKNYYGENSHDKIMRLELYSLLENYLQ